MTEMKAVMSRILDPEISLRKRLFQLLSTIALVEYCIVTVYNLVSGSSTTQIVIMLIGTILFAATVAFTFKTGHIRVGSTISGLLYFCIYPLTFFSAGGMYGGAPPVFAFALVYVFLVTEKWERTAALAVCMEMVNPAQTTSRSGTVLTRIMTAAPSASGWPISIRKC